MSVKAVSCHVCILANICKMLSSNCAYEFYSKRPNYIQYKGMCLS